MVSPVPSITRASDGGATFAPTASMRPPRTTTVPRSIGGPDTGTTRAPVIAHTPGGAASAQRPPAGLVQSRAKSDSATDARRKRLDLIGRSPRSGELNRRVSVLRSPVYVTHDGRF